MGNESDELELVEVKKPDIEDKVEKKIKPNWFFTCGGIYVTF